jgi:hypothetical protein
MKLVNDFTQDFGESGSSFSINSKDWWAMMKKYYYQKDEQSEKIYVSGKLTLGKSITDNYSLGKKLSGDDVPSLIRTVVKSGRLPEDPNSIYFVLISSDVKEQMKHSNSRYCEEYCGYHGEDRFHFFNPHSKMFYALAGQYDRYCAPSCSPNYAHSPNNDPSVDTAMSVIAHELAETVSDPWAFSKRAWNSMSGEENGDLCAQVYGKAHKLPNGAIYNYVAPNSKLKFLIQQNFDPESQECSSGS